MFKLLLKKIWIRCFTKHPYKISSFQQLYAIEIGLEIDQPELLTEVLTNEQGRTYHFRNFPNCLNAPLILRKVSGKPRFVLSGIFKEPNRILYSIASANILGQIGIIYDSTRRTFINESAQEWEINLKKSKFTNILRYPKVKRLEGVTISFLTNGADGGFYHFLFESLSKAMVYEQVLADAKYFLFNGPSTSWKVYWIKKARIDVSKIIWVQNDGHYHCEQLIFCNKLVADQQVNPWCIHSLRQLLKIETRTVNIAKKVVWITRKNQSSRNIIWEDKVFEHFPHIERINPSELSIDASTEILRQATHIIGPHGAGFCNIFVCSKETQILELFPNEQPFQPCYFRLAEICELKYNMAYVNFKAIDDENTGAVFLLKTIEEFLCAS